MSYPDLKLNTPYFANSLTISNDKRKPHKTNFHGKTVYIRENNPKNNDIPSLEHGFVHVYDEAGEYYGACGIFYFARAVGLMSLKPEEDCNKITEWHILSKIEVDGNPVEVMAAASCDGIGVIARWVKRKNGGWNVFAADTEQFDMPRIDFEEEEYVPPEPPV